ncbi:MAG TPA: hypothetical protein VHJ17_03945 [Thermomonospora sp.]|nr:hypothetical protein [Thermomonospora sp.]
MAEYTIRTGYGSLQLAARLGLARWQLRVAGERGLIPPPDLDGGRWSAALAEQTAGRAAEIRAALGDDPPVGAVKAAERLSVRVGLDVERADVEALVVSGALAMADHYNGRALYDPRDLDALDAERVTAVVAARKGPLAETVNARGAATLLGWPPELFARVAAERGLNPDPLGRFPLAEVRRLGADQELRTTVARHRRAAAVESGRRDAARAEQSVRRWLRHCSDYLAHDADGPPDTRELTRALRTLSTARASLRHPDSVAEEV